MSFKFKLPPKTPVFVELEGQQVDVKSIPNRSLTVAQHKTIRAHSDGFRALFKKYDDECLAHVAKYYQSNASPDRRITYDDAIIWNILPELLKRLQDAQDRIVGLELALEQCYSDGDPHIMRIAEEGLKK